MIVLMLCSVHQPSLFHMSKSSLSALSLAKVISYMAHLLLALLHFVALSEIDMQAEVFL